MIATSAQGSLTVTLSALMETRISISLAHATDQDVVTATNV